MKSDKNIFGQLMHDRFIKEFLESSESQSRFNISVISSICLELADVSDEECTSEFRLACVNRILNQCGQMMKMVELYSSLSEALNYDDSIMEKIDISDFLSDFSDECRRCLKNVCKVNFISGESIETSVNKKLLNFALILYSYVRYVALTGVKAIDISYAPDDDKAVIFINITKRGKSADFENMLETVTIDYAEQIISAIVKKMNALFIKNDVGMKLYIPIKDCGGGLFNSPAKPYGKPIFSTFNNMLSDVGDITLI